VQHAYASAGSYSVVLTVTDNMGATAQKTQSVNVSSPPNSTPVAAFTYTCNNSSRCNFNDTSTDSGGQIVGWAWDFGDGAAATQQNPSHQFATSGTFSVRLTVTDNGGLSDSFNSTVTCGMRQGNLRCR
jgi:PKD repeat protein